MFGQFDFYIHGNQVELSGQSFLLGELTCDLLNISPTEFEEMRALMERADSEAIRHLHNMLMSYQLFKLIAPSEAIDDADAYRHVLSDIYSFNQTMFWFIDQGLMHLHKLDSENFAAALYDFYSHPSLDKMMVNHLRNGVHSFSLFDSIDVRYVPREIPDQPDCYAIYEVYSAQYLQAFLKMDFMKALMSGHTFRRCKNCKRFFLLTQGYKTDYCDRPLAENPKRTCRQQGAKNIAKEKAKNNPVLQSYNRAYRRITADKRRGNIPETDWRRAKQRLADLRDMAISGRLRDAEMERLVRSEELYPSLGIERKNR
ncbi:MAG: DUF6076 domain-containing protein [Oscillospiraceae bacterium]|nr:DUF6076 domain-containing protein [Oscillospiraceae bacterium]